MGGKSRCLQHRIKIHIVDCIVLGIDLPTAKPRARHPSRDAGKKSNQTTCYGPCCCYCCLCCCSCCSSSRDGFMTFLPLLSCCVLFFSSWARSETASNRRLFGLLCHSLFALRAQRYSTNSLGAPNACLYLLETFLFDICMLFKEPFCVSDALAN